VAPVRYPPQLALRSIREAATPQMPRIASASLTSINIPAAKTMADRPLCRMNRLVAPRRQRRVVGTFGLLVASV
jgi:hypothetical protein